MTFSTKEPIRLDDLCLTYLSQQVIRAISMMELLPEALEEALEDREETQQEIVNRVATKRLRPLHGIR